MVPTGAAPPTRNHDASQTPVVAWPERDLRRVAAVVSAGFVLGILINGVGSRLAMMLLARLNPDVTGRLSDDGFVMGHFRLRDTIGLIAVGMIAGVLGGLVFLAVEGLRTGPPWFRTTSMVVGPAVVVGATLVHSTGIDFVVLQPLWLAVALFVALPGMFAGAMLAMADRWLAEGSWFMTGSRWRLVTLAPVLLMLPIVPVIAGAAAGRAAYVRLPKMRAIVPPSALRHTGRVVLALVFVLALADLMRDVVALAAA